MKRLSLVGLVGVLASVLAGCPIFDDGPGNGYGSGCPGNDCFNPAPECTTAAECGLNETCGSDQKCHTGDCTIWGCASGTCVTHDDQTASCDDGSGGSGATGGSGTSSGGTGAGAGPNVVYCGNPDDCASGETCAPETYCKAGDCNAVGCIYGYSCDAPSGLCKFSNPAACGTDGDCLDAGFACVSGICTAPEDQCFDGGQCGGVGKCVGGKCITSCSTDATCSDAYTCDTALGTCSTPAKACAITKDCGDAITVCVEGACVPRSVNGACPSGTAWVENGCVPDQKAKFTCVVDGTQDQCAMSSLCLHHGCYISCEGSASAACDNLPEINLCKTVTSTSGEHQVCGSSSTLGGECDPQAGVACVVGKICVDGYCK